MQWKDKPLRLTIFYSTSKPKTMKAGEIQNAQNFREEKGREETKCPNGT
jgi:hypothetical protein